MIDNEKNILNEEELQGVSGGKSASSRAKAKAQLSSMPTERHFCKKCNMDKDFIVYSGSRPVCSTCGTLFSFGS